MSWKSRSIKRRDYRHDHEATGDEPSTGKARSKRRRPPKGHAHNFNDLVAATSYYNVYRCPCGKKHYTWRSLASRLSRRSYSVDAVPSTITMEKLFPIHDEGTCKVCDERRKALDKRP